MRIVLLGLLLALAAGAEEGAGMPPVVPILGSDLKADGFPQWGVGPLDPRDPFPLALLHFTIPVHDPSTLARNTFSASFDTTWANTNAVSSEFVVDAEVIASRLSLAYGVTNHLQV